MIHLAMARTASASAPRSWQPTPPTARRRCSPGQSTAVTFSRTLRCSTCPPAATARSSGMPSPPIMTTMATSAPAASACAPGTATFQPLGTMSAKTASSAIARDRKTAVAAPCGNAARPTWPRAQSHPLDPRRGSRLCPRHRHNQRLRYISPPPKERRVAVCASQTYPGARPIASTRPKRCQGQVSNSGHCPKPTQDGHVHPDAAQPLPESISALQYNSAAT